MNKTVQTLFYTAPPVDLDEVLRYAGCREGGEDMRALASSCVKEAEPFLSYRVCCRRMDVSDREFAELCGASEQLKTHLSDCDGVILFAASVGIGIDRLTAKYSRISPSRAVMVQAVGAERIEALCDAFCRDMAKETKRETKTRFSPGYGDWSIEKQTEIFRLLEPYRHIGLYLGKSLLMTPTKSVTAILPIKSKE